MTEEAIFYNSLNIFCQSDYSCLKKYKNQFGGWGKAWRELRKKEPLSDPEKGQGKLEKRSVKLILLEDNDYPPLLKEVFYPPFGIYILGDLPPADKPILAIVGTRKATNEGKELAENFASELARAGLIIVSGLALGIDAAAHQGCLRIKGKTLAVLGNGLDSFYPRTNEKLADKILKSGGAIISEYPLESPSFPSHFLERNRIVSGLSKGVLIIEAPEKSGSLVTARLALEQNREVFVIPGPVNHPNFRGSHQLIRSGAELITKPAEILENLGLIETTNNKELSLETDAEKQIITLLQNSREKLGIDKIIEITNLETQIVNQTISFLLVKNIIEENDEGYKIK